VDLDTLADWERGEWLVGKGELKMIRPKTLRPMEANLRILMKKIKVSCAGLKLAWSS